MVFVESALLALSRRLASRLLKCETTFNIRVLFCVFFSRVKMAGWLTSKSRDYILHPIFYNRDISWPMGFSLFSMYGSTAWATWKHQALGDPSEHRAKVAGTTGIARVWSPNSDPSILDMVCVVEMRNKGDESSKHSEGIPEWFGHRILGVLLHPRSWHEHGHSLKIDLIAWGLIWRRLYCWWLQSR